MGYIPPPRPLSYPMTRDSVPPPPPPPKRIINEGWPSIMKPKKKENKKVKPKIDLITRDYDGAQFVKYSDADGYRMIPLGNVQMMKKLVDVRDKHGRIRMDVHIDEEGFPILKIENADESGYLKVKLPKDVKDEDVKNVVAQYYHGYTPLDMNADYLADISVKKSVKEHAEKVHSKIKNSKNGIIQIEGSIEDNELMVSKPWFPPNRLINESTGEVTYDYVSEEQKRQWPQPQLKKDADPPKKKPKEAVKPVEPKPEYGETINIRKKKSRWDRFIDRIIKNIVWGK